MTAESRRRANGHAAPDAAAASGTSRAESGLFIVLLMLGALGLYLGWRLFWFLTDDAFIEYRYVSNSMLGYGYVWNAPPFLPVEGYTSFLWLVVIDVVWRVTGVEPPRSANLISLLFSYGTLVLAALMTLRMPWVSSLKRSRTWFVGLVLLGLLLNRTFLAWTSSGLETAMFNFYVTLWVFAVFFQSSLRRRIALASLAAMLIALTRPDGLVFVAGTCAMTLLSARAAPDPKAASRMLLSGSLSVVGVIAHTAWRRSFYGEWLPNTYYAKVVEPWPLSGAIYAASFILEYSLWFPLAIFIWAAVSAARRGPRRWPKPDATPEERLASRGVPALAMATLAFQLGYYTFIVGGDHFEYRVYSYSFPLLFVAFLFALDRLALRPATAGLLMTAFILLSLPVPWTHWERTHDLQTRAETQHMRVPIAPAWPEPFRWYARAFDRAQDWLILRLVCMRHQEHKVFLQTQIHDHPSREQGSRIPREGFPVYAVYKVGIPSWVFVNVNIIDKLGLNDYVIARTPVPPDRFRKMAHTRRPPRGYVESYRTNVTSEGTVRQRAVPLTADEIVRTEARWRALVTRLRSDDGRR